MAQFVSNCDSQSDREGLVESLKKHLKVDVFGGCGTLKCDPRTPEECYQRLNLSYKFYLSLENSVCQVGLSRKSSLSLDYEILFCYCSDK